MRRLAALAFAFAVGVARALAPGEAWTVLDTFDDLAGWSVEATEGVKARLVAESGVESGSMCLAFDFGKVSGYALVRKRIALDFPENFELAFDVRGEAPANALHVRFADASGENVWWRPLPEFRPPVAWTPVHVKKRHVAFAWGPAKDRVLAHTATVEFAIAREQGGAGRVCFDRLAWRSLPAVAPAPPGPVASASSSAPGSAASLATDGAAATGWRSAAAGEQDFTLDLGVVREFGGLALRWLPGSQARRYEVELSEDGERWTTVRRVDAGGAGEHSLRLPESEARYVRLHLHETAGDRYGLAEIALRDLASGATPNAFFQALAREAPRGRYPRGFSGEQSYWTVLGIDGGPVQALLSEDGALEARPGEAAIEPLLLADGRVVTWADAEISHSLAEGDLPIPTVAWRAAGLALRVTAFGAGTPSRAQVVARYDVENLESRPRDVVLVLAARPFQVNPPTQFLNLAGGVASLASIAWTNGAWAFDGEARAWTSPAPDAAIAAAFDAGNLPDLLASGGPLPASVADPVGLASGGLRFTVRLPARGRKTVALVMPLAGAPTPPGADAASWLDEQQRTVAASWREKLGRVQLTVPPEAQPLARTLRTALAHVLIERRGPALQPGTRAYARSWIRDGALTSEALLRMGHAPAVRAFADWFAPHQFPSGKVPCCADARGADPVPENDSHGEWIRLVHEYFRYTHDREWLRGKWPGVVRAVEYMETLRREGRGMEGAGPLGYAGLMPPSISHEGYSDRPAWSYWDDAWALAGYRSAADLASTLGDAPHARQFAGERDGFARDLAASVRASQARHGIEFIPGSADRGDFDATSTTVLLDPGGALDLLPRAAFDATFERYWSEFTARRDGARAWEDYTPYEIRNVGAFVRLGWRDRAQELLAYFMRDRRPPAWNQWAEVVGREPRKPRFIGDMPHGWVASDFIRSALDLFAYERAADRAIVLAAGIPDAWLGGTGVAIEGLRTPWGPLSYALRREGNAIVLAVPAGCAMPPGGLVLPGAWTGAGERRITSVPARVELRRY